MENNESESKKKKILNKIFIKEEDTLKELEKIVNECFKHFKINVQSNRPIVFEPHIKKIPSKILLLLIGVYLMKQNGHRNSDSVNISELSEKVGIKKTSLSKPLGILISQGYIRKDSSGNYFVEHYKIKEILGEIKN